ncbi:MAG: hypothetical protein Q9182_000518 [Xanthomendoza sp. 2 TL-2023]
MLPLGLLNAAQGHPMLVELKNGETLNGHLISCDTWMNLTLKEVVQTNPEVEEGAALFNEAEVIEEEAVPEVAPDVEEEEVEEGKQQIPDASNNTEAGESHIIKVSSGEPGQLSKLNLKQLYWKHSEITGTAKSVNSKTFDARTPPTVRILRPLTKTVSRRCLCTTRRLNDSKIRFIRKNAPPWIGRRANQFEEENGFFSSDQDPSSNLSNQVAYFLDGLDKDQSRPEKKTLHTIGSKISDNEIQRHKSPCQLIESPQIPELVQNPLEATNNYHEQLHIRPESEKETDKYVPSPNYTASRSSGFKVHRGRRSSELLDEELYEELRRAGTAGDYHRIREVLRILIQERGVKPDRRHYQALLLANINAQHGSPVEVARVLEDMEDEGIVLDSAAYHTIIKVLAVHPDYLVRRQVMEELRQRWFTLSNDGWHDVIVGLLREKQLELAVETLQSVQQEGIRVQPWLYDLVIFNLCDVGEYDEALSILRFRVDNGEQLISGNVWHYLLDTASRAFHHAATLFVWRRRVGTSYLNPSSGMCLNVLHTAARHGNVRLATDVIRVLSNRNQPLQLYHYEALIEAYVPAQLRTAFTLLALMASSGTPPAVSSTRPIFLHLCESSHLPDAALAILRQVAKHRRNLPAEAVNVVIEAYIYHNKMDQALDTYKTLHTFCPSGPVISTFNTLFRGCRGRKNTAMFLASEMVALKVRPDALTYDRLILVCLEAQVEEEGFEDAWRYLEEMRGAGWWPRSGTAMALAKKCCLMGDERIWRLQGDDYDEEGIAGSVIQRMIDRNWMKAGSGHGRSWDSAKREDEDVWT